jgi:hypothetical protein
VAIRKKVVVVVDAAGEDMMFVVLGVDCGAPWRIICSSKGIFGVDSQKQLCTRTRK